MQQTAQIMEMEEKGNEIACREESNTEGTIDHGNAYLAQRPIHMI